MFDMNKLWESFIYVSLKNDKAIKRTVTGQTSKYFWKQDNHNRTSIKPDIVINKGDLNNCIVLDTKWKMILNKNPSPDDLRQLYVYHEYYKAKKVALIYPGESILKTSGKYLDPITGEKLNKECSVITLSVDKKIKAWQNNISTEIETWINQN